MEPALAAALTRLLSVLVPQSKHNSINSALVVGAVWTVARFLGALLCEKAQAETTLK